MSKRYKRGQVRWQIIDILQQYGDWMTVEDIAQLLPDVPVGTIGGRLSMMTSEKRLICDREHRPYRWKMNNAYDPSAVNQKPATDNRNNGGTDLAVVDPWERVRVQWRVVFGVQVSSDDARLMVELAAREARRTPDGQ